MSLFSSAKTVGTRTSLFEPVHVKLVIVPEGLVAEDSSLYLTIKHFTQEVIDAITSCGNVANNHEEIAKVIQERLKIHLGLDFPEIMLCETPMDFQHGLRQIMVGVKVTPAILAEHDSRDNLAALITEVFGRQP